MRTPFKKSLPQISLEEAHGGSGSRQLILSKADPISEYFEAMTKGFLKAGSRFDWHQHDNIDEFFLVIKGTGKVTFKNSIVLEYKENDLIYIPANIEHQIEADNNLDNEFYFFRLRS